ncbi:nickel-binding protein [Haloechinothrix salitolerans]|uniref:Nickel-binding protein n=1 Tax=Haloechinothrix salitolerans TaxID=926830 RepID=A0ABW2C134_9PSEU
MDEYFMVDWVLPPTQLVDLQTAQHAIDAASRRLTEEGHRVRCLHSTYVPAQRRWVCVFMATSAEAIRKIHEIAQLPVPRVESALDLTLVDRLAS